MSETRVVFDCNTFLQGLAAPEGPAGSCVQLAFDRIVLLFISPTVLEELREVTSRPKVAAKLKLDPLRVEEFLNSITFVATLLEGFPNPFSYARDPDDAHYVNLAVAADANLIVTRDKDLLDLTNADTPESISFRARFSTIRILNPVAFLQEMSTR